MSLSPLPRMHSSIRAFASLLAIGCVATMTGCASQSSSKPGYVRDAIQQELTQARQSKPAVPAAPANLDLSLLPPLQTDVPRPSSMAESRFDLSVQNAPAAQVFQGIVNGTRYSMMINPEISGNITISLKNVTVKEALDAIRDVYGYEYRVQGNRISIQPNTIQTRIFHFNYLVARRVGSTDMRVSSGSLAGSSATGSGTGTTNTATGTPNTGTGTTTSTSGNGSTSISTKLDNDFWRDVKETLKMVVGDGEGRSVSLNPGAGIVVVRALPSEIRNVESYLKATQLVIDREVMLEAKILDIELNDTSQSGVNWAAFRGTGSTRATIGTVGSGNTLAPSGSTATLASTNDIAAGVASGVLGAATSGAGFVGLAFQTNTFAALLNFLETQGTVHTLSSPRIATLNNQKAVLKVGKDGYYVTGVSTSFSSTATTGGTVSNIPVISYTTQVFFSGVALDVTPQIDENDSMVLHVHPVVSQVTTTDADSTRIDPTPGQTISSAVNLPVNKIKESDSIVRVQDGHIVAIGGLMDYEQTTSKNQLPGTGDTALSGLFGQRGDTYKKHELVILIKPTIIKHEDDWQSDMEATQARFGALGR